MAENVKTTGDVKLPYAVDWRQWKKKKTSHSLDTSLDHDVEKNKRDSRCWLLLTVSRHEINTTTGGICEAVGVVYCWSAGGWQVVLQRWDSFICIQEPSVTSVIADRQTDRHRPASDNLFLFLSATHLFFVFFKTAKHSLAHYKVLWWCTHNTSIMLFHCLYVESNIESSFYNPHIKVHIIAGGLKMISITLKK